MFKAIGLGLSLIPAAIMGVLVVAWFINAGRLVVTLILSIPPIKRRAKARWCKQLRIFYGRRKYPMAEY